MEQPTMALSAIYLESNGGYVGFIQELPAIHSYGRSLQDARKALMEIARVVFAEERRACEEMLGGKSVVREHFVLSRARGGAS